MQSNNSHQYRKDIDGLRAVSILAVLVFHFAPAVMPNGYLGVDVFFVISGFLITNIYLERDEDFSFREFYTRRSRRLFPPMMLVVATGILASEIVFTEPERINLLKNATYSMLFLANVHSYNALGYFEESALRAPFLHLWSLSVEWQLYFSFGFLILISRRRRTTLFLFSLILLAASFLLSIHLRGTDFGAHFYLVQARAWEFLAGVVLALVMQKRQLLINSRYLREFGSIAVLLILIVTFSLPNIPGSSFLFPQLVVVSASLLFISQSYESRFKYIFTNPLIVYIGKCSYSLYLWHWLVYSTWVTVDGDIPTKKVRVALIVASFLLAISTFEMLEKRIARGVISNRLIGITLVGLLTLGFLGWNQKDFRENSNDPFAEMAIKAPQTNDLCLKRYPYQRQYKSHWFCLLSKDSSPQIVLLGNSFANDHYFGLAKAPELAHQSILSFGNCDAASPATKGEVDFPRERSNCSTFNMRREHAFVDSIILNSGTVRYVIIDGLRADPDEKYIDRLKNRILKFEKANIETIILYPRFKHHIDINRCFDRPFLPARNCRFPLSEYEDLRESFSPLVNEFSSGYSFIKFYDQNELYCSKEFCSPVKYGRALSADLRTNGGGHLNPFGSEVSAGYLINWFQAQLPTIFDR